MKPIRTVIILISMILLVACGILNWGLLKTPVEVNYLFGTTELALGAGLFIPLGLAFVLLASIWVPGYMQKHRQIRTLKSELVDARKAAVAAMVETDANEEIRAELNTIEEQNRKIAQRVADAEEHILERIPTARREIVESELQPANADS